MSDKARHAFGALENVDSAISSKKIDSYDILFVKNAEGKPFVGWVDKDGNKVIVDNKDEFAALEVELAKKANTEYVETLEGQIASKANAEDITALETELANKVTVEEVDAKIVEKVTEKVEEKISEISSSYEVIEF
jgi:hypothetical protein